MESEILLAKIAELEAKIAALELGDDAGAINDRGPCFPIPQMIGSMEPWMFECKEVNGVRTGGWTNCRCQIGLDIDWGSADVKNTTVDWANLTDAAKDQLTSAHVILGTNLCADGIYFLYVELANKIVDHDAAKIVNSADPNYDSYHTDTTAGTFLIPIGTVDNGSLSAGAPHINPVIYKYL